MAPFPVIASGSVLSLTIGADGPHAVRFPRQPVDVADAAVLLEAAIRLRPASAARRSSVRAARVTTDNENLVIIPGRLQEAVGFAVDAVSGSARAR